MLDLKELSKIKNTWQKVGFTTDDDFVEYVKKQNIKLGASVFLDINNPDFSKKLLQFGSSLGLKTARLSLRLNQYEQNIKKLDDIFELDLTPHFELFDYALKLGFEVTINIGPIKTMCWPESFLPKLFYEEFQIPKNNKWYFLKKNEEDFASKILDFILTSLKARYGQKLPFRAVQLDNEPFNLFGEPIFWLNKKNITNTISSFQEHFPVTFSKNNPKNNQIPDANLQNSSSSKILLNAAGRFNLSKFVDIIKKNPEQKFIIGLDYYYDHPVLYKFKQLKNWQKNVDGMILASPFDPTISKLKKLSKKYNFEIEITEAQFEPWGMAKNPGNRVEDFKFLTLRCIYFLETENCKIINLWNLNSFYEKFLNNEFTDENNKISQLIQKINQNSSS